MPLINSSYRAPWYLFNGHLQTIVPFWRDQIDNDLYLTEQLELSDGDFLELDWRKSGANRLMVISHGLEGNSRSHYVKQAAVYFSQRGWDVLAWNFRSCGRSMNRHLRFYHAGETEDIGAVMDHVLRDHDYSSIVMMGHSIGGAMTLNYAGAVSLDARIKALVTFSVPCDPQDCERQLQKRVSRIYLKKFLSKLKRKLRLKAHQFPALDLQDLDSTQTLTVFNEKWTAPIHGFSTMDEFYAQGHCKNVLPTLTLPCLMVNALNDPFLGPACHPVQEAESSDFFFLEIPRSGGHAGFSLINKQESWMEHRTEAFLQTHTDCG